MRGNSNTSILGVALFQVADSLDKLLNWNGLVVIIQMTLACQTGIVNQNISIGSDASNSTNDITRAQIITYTKIICCLDTR